MVWYTEDPGKFSTRYILWALGFGLLLERAQVGVLRVLRCAMTNDNRVLHKGHLIITGGNSS